VGLACRTGHFVVVRKTDEANFERIWELTEFKNTGAKAIKPYVDSLLACPFFAAHSADGDRYVLGVLFVDSAEADFFDDELVLDAIAASCRGFVELLEKLTQSRALRPLVDIYLGFKVQKDDETADLVGELQKLGAKFCNCSPLLEFEPSLSSPRRAPLIPGWEGAADFVGGGLIGA
jgi:hypothetical protein